VEELQFVCIKQEKLIVKFAVGLLFALNIIKKNLVARNAKAHQFVNTTNDGLFVSNVKENLFANTIKDVNIVKIAKDLLYVNTISDDQIVKYARDHLFAFMKKIKDYVNNAGVQDYVKQNIVKQKLQKNIMDIVCPVVSKCSQK
jgi:hypothetical protein